MASRSNDSTRTPEKRDDLKTKACFMSSRMTGGPSQNRSWQPRPRPYIHRKVTILGNRDLQPLKIKNRDPRFQQVTQALCGYFAQAVDANFNCSCVENMAGHSLPAGRQTRRQLPFVWPGCQIPFRCQPSSAFRSIPSCVSVRFHRRAG